MFRLIALPLFVLDLWLALALCRHFERVYPAKKRLLRLLAAAAFVIVFHPVLVMWLARATDSQSIRALVPDDLMMICMGMQFAMVLTVLLTVCWKVARRGYEMTLARLRPRAANRKSETADSTATTAPPNESVFSLDPMEPESGERRRLVLGAAAAIPMIALGISAGGVIASRQRPVVTRLRLPVRREFSELHGVTIAQVSDLHIGSYMDADRLDEIRDAMNALGADFHVITGDLLDNHVSQLELATRFIRGLTPRRGEIFFGMGNHEYIAARSTTLSTIVDALEDAGAQILIDSARPIRVGSSHLWMAGLDYPPSRHIAEYSTRSTEHGLQRILGQVRDDGAPRIVLSHHPKTFFEAREQPIDLMLSGHTHGGQFKLGRVGDYALTPVLPLDFYHNGLYEHEGRKLFVNSGAGGWFPVRINCPPELTLVELIAA